MLLGVVANAPAWSATTVIFTAPSPTITHTIFPSDLFTKPAPTKTGLQVQLPNDENDCHTGGKAICGYQALLNGQDGFNVNPRISVCFSAAVDETTLRGGISFVAVEKPNAGPIGINQIILNHESNCMYAKPDRVLDQQTRYLLLVRNSIISNGQKVEADISFHNCLMSGNPYCATLQAVLAPLHDDTVVGASLFTTMNATSWLQGAYQYVDKSQPGLVLPAGFPWIFPVKNLRSITWNPDNAPAVVGSPDIPINTALADVGKIAFGLYFSPNYLNTSGPSAGAITSSPDQPVPVPALLGGLTFGYVPVSFHVFLPKTPAPAGGYPVVIYGHGLSDSQFGAPTYIASTLARAGYATLAMEITGHGYGANSTVSIKDRFGLTYKMLTPGRGIQIVPGQPIGASDGCILPGPLAVRDCGRQTAVDLFALIKTIQRTNGLILGLNPNAISYVGQSFGSIYGTLMQAVAPEVKMAVFNGGGGPFVDVARLALNGRPLGVQYLCGLGLLNVGAPAAGVCGPEGFNNGQALPQDYFHDSFNDNYVYRDQLPVVNDVTGALEIQAAFEAAEWLGMVGDALSFAPHLKAQPLPSVPAKSTLLQFGDGDLEVPNPTNIAFAGAAQAKDFSIRFLFPLALGPNPEYAALAGITDPSSGSPLPILPHRVLSNPTIFDTPLANQQEKAISIAEQSTVAEFFDGNGSAVPNSNKFLNTTGGLYQGRTLFEPGADIPSGLNFVQILPNGQPRTSNQ